MFCGFVLFWLFLAFIVYQAGRVIDRLVAVRGFRARLGRQKQAHMNRIRELSIELSRLQRQEQGPVTERKLAKVITRMDALRDASDHDIDMERRIDVFSDQTWDMFRHIWGRIKIRTCALFASGSDQNLDQT
ncbi:hypothetical protein CYLTODRAFT_418967 [Cylindrobasidium torrendii FP15055 ss-10]|uniref:Uncharacterized protein n=1 Tax=Cylindrobasidium torrendii FP15055 ss-10 TaxID=1314674 RepID=A0A0D7BMA9_9AGAR|nr:hypothetical protein CYLTODRAFT_418967 [Cylindrobasidium torrendii FP15055 ss-10]